ncbi:MAG TPA: 30S ribosomal protein S16 [Candidatus Binatia bacterium]|nr:30S ribosomal protein S16 [Candidatus Binatia bacterium]
MPTTIRLARFGGKKTPFYRIVVADSRAPRNGRCLDQVGIYDPTKKPVRLEFRTEKVTAWLKTGARPSTTVAQLLRKSGITAPAAAPGSGETPS